MKIFIRIALIGIFTTTLFGQTPNFSNYAAQVEKVTAQEINFKSHQDARKFRSNLKARLKVAQTEGADFAGSFIVASWGCGTSCLQSAIINGKTGEVFFPIALQGSSVGFGELADDDTGSIQYQKDSRLLIVRGYTGVGFARDGTTINSKRYGLWHYEWTGKRLKLLKFTPKKEHMN